MKKNIFIVASGTGGHVIPAKNIASLLIDQIIPLHGLAQNTE